MRTPGLDLAVFLEKTVRPNPAAGARASGTAGIHVAQRGGEPMAQARSHLSTNEALPQTSRTTAPARCASLACSAGFAPLRGASRLARGRA
jgi:hypothetical protein